MKIYTRRFAVSSFAFFFLTGGLFANDNVDFSRDIRPILSDKCFQCHGPDLASREAGLRLDVEGDAQEYAFVPGALDESEGWLRIISTDQEVLMPPPDSHKKLDSREKQLLKRWIESGAKYQKHWSFQEISAPKIPSAIEKTFAKSAIDSFIVYKMHNKGLHPSPRASKQTLIRRASLDLIGLPPTRAEVNSFLADQDENAFEKVVDRLLNSPHFGERMAVEWLDVARYGDTSVFHADGPRDMWRWRDWVVSAYNNNMPFDQFTIKQLAGDMLPNKTVEDHIASGFNRNNASTDEGGAIAEEFRIEYAVDRVKTTSMVWMGLSMECAQCHDHKYDPISQEDYYRFFAFFNQAADPGMQSRRGNQSPTVNILDAEKIAKVPAVEAQIVKANVALSDLESASRETFPDWLANCNIEDHGSEPPQDTIAYFDFEQQAPAKIVNVSNAEDDIKQSGKVEFSKGKLGNSVRVRGNNYLSSMLTAAKFSGDTALSFGCWVQLAGGQAGAPLARMDEGKGHVGFDLYLQADGVAAHFIHSWPQNAIKVVAKKKLEKSKWHHLFVTYDGTRKANGIRIFVDGKHIESKPTHNTLTGSTLTDAPFNIGRRRNSSHFNGFVDDVRVYERLLSDSEVATVANADPLPGLLAKSPSERTDDDLEQLFEIYLDREVSGHATIEKNIADLNAKIATLQTPITSVMVMKDVDKPRMTYVLDRGQYDAPNKEKPVTAGVPSFLPDFAGLYKPNRLGMAQWLTSPDHPLTSRVAVNRIWKNLFGVGLVESLEDFGFQGSWPSHPELLDWLASDFVANGWNTKRLIKMIVTSETYQQKSAVTDRQLKLDPSNRYLSRGPRFRLPGEFLRDQALALSGLLNTKIGGPGVKPYQPEGLWNEVSLNGGLRFKRDDGEKLYRRSLYTYWKRSAPPPNMVIFDAPTREQCTVRRGHTNTPLQALVMMNDPQFVEAARIFAERILREGGESVAEKVEFAFQVATARKPTMEEVQILTEVLKNELKTFETRPGEADKLLAVGEHPRDTNLEATEVAAWTIISNLIFNLDEFVTRG